MMNVECRMTKEIRMPKDRIVTEIESGNCSGVGFGLGTGDGAARPIVATRARRYVEAFHEPQSAAGILPAEESEKSSADETSAAPCWRPNLTRSRFMVPMHSKK